MNEIVADPWFMWVHIALLLALLAGLTYGITSWLNRKPLTKIIGSNGDVIAELPYDLKDIVIGIDVDRSTGRERVVYGLRQPDGSLNIFEIHDRTVDDE